MALPKAVQQQLEEADRIVADINGEKTGEDSSETNPVNQQVDQDIQADPPLNDLPPDNTVSQETKQPEVPEEKWAHKYHTLKGMYDAEVPRLHSQVREMQTQIQQLIADKAAVEATKVEQKQVVESLITEQDKEAFGPDLIDLIERATESKVGTLREREPVYGVPRQAALSNAYEVLDVTRVANIFKAYKQTLPQTPAPSRAKQELQRQVAPTRTRSTTTPTDNVNDKIFTNQDIEQFYNDWRRGFYDEQEAADMEKQIHTAIAEGRIR